MKQVQEKPVEAPKAKVEDKKVDVEKKAPE
jgi:hypothetical protein